MMTTQESQALRAELMKNNKDFIMKFFYSPIQKFLIRNYTEFESRILSYSKIDIRKITTKEEITDLVCLWYNDEEIVSGYLADLPETDRAVLSQATWKQALDRKELEEIFVKTPLLHLAKLWSNYLVVQLTPEIKARWGEYITLYEPSGYYEDRQRELRDTGVSLSLPLELRKLLAIHLPKPEGYHIKPVPEPGKHFVTYLTESIITAELPRIISYHSQGNIKYSQKGNPNVASAKKMSRSLKLATFGPEDDTPVRSLLIAGLLSDDFKMKTISQSSHETIKTLFARDFNRKQAAPYMLTHLKGLNYFQISEYRPNTTATIIEIFRKLVPGQWITFDNLKSFISSRFINISPLLDWQIRDRIDAEYAIISNDGSLVQRTISVNSGNAQPFVILPYLAAHVYLLASFGLMDIALDPALPNLQSTYQNLFAFRITALGAYVLGLSRQYTPVATDFQTTLSFDENSTFIRVEGDTVLAEIMLNNYATKVSENRYQFSPGKFLKECKSTRDIQNKIILFKQTIGQKLPVFWENYLQELVSNSKSINSQSEIQVFTIPPDNKALQRMIVQDEILRKLVVKAEQYHILIENSKLTAFTSRMKELGYVLN
ncbi:hypothetical protein [Dyadobacter frigoris]|uniref:Helicase XPB/Ssl2 N-terminal domain-containing protein n=1 Tax=Dyadobacter frigoris TaxID=2576211 RepID=A0A4V6Y1W9_9BACT|nr:hypothetical protein [Dyadobacter frigoris]TKT89703.1 hypothetical protein FDK13_22900 [Dyadobacter frigoris]GLU54071.1 hypothetical protein Dfri01_35320 [Dyadobacter frigoris]